jgi:hypothetical protein
VSGRPNASEGEPGFYVGYLPLPARDRAFLRAAVPAVLVAFAALAAWFAASQRPGAVNGVANNGVWETGTETTLVGELVASPYPMLRVARADGSVERVLLVEMGKHGAGPRVTPLVPTDGTRVAASVRGFRIERDGQRMLELSEGADAIALGGEVPSRSDVRAVGTVTLVGEIVDSKCWLGVMKPGEGTAHRDCASLCIRGGIPPSIVCRAPDGATRRALLVSHDGAAIAFEELAPWIARPVEVRGRAEVVDGTAIVRVESIASASGRAP